MDQHGKGRWHTDPGVQWRWDHNGVFPPASIFDITHMVVYIRVRAYGNLSHFLPFAREHAHPSEGAWCPNVAVDRHCKGGRGRGIGADADFACQFPRKRLSGFPQFFCCCVSRRIGWLLCFLTTWTVDEKSTVATAAVVRVVLSPTGRDHEKTASFDRLRAAT